MEMISNRIKFPVLLSAPGLSDFNGQHKVAVRYNYVGQSRRRVPRRRTVMPHCAATFFESRLKISRYSLFQFR